MSHGFTAEFTFTEIEDNASSCVILNSLSQKIYCETLVAEFLTYHKYVHFKLI